MTNNILIFIVILLGITGCNSSTESVTEGTMGITSTITEETTDIIEITDMATEETPEVARKVNISTVETKPSEWYIRLIAKDLARNMQTGGAQLGELDASNAVSEHTLKALSPFGGSYLEIVFINPDGVIPGDYANNFHTYKEVEEDNWSFTVRTDDITADILLAWRGLYVLTSYVDSEGRTRYKEHQSHSNPLLKQMKIVDTSTGEEIPVIVEDTVQSFAFNMNGQNERTFRWVLVSEEVEIPEYQPKMQILQAKAIKKDASSVSEEKVQIKVDAFDLNNPPRVKDQQK